MIKSSSEPSPYQTCFTNGSDICVADSGAGPGGTYGFRPQELLEAALATSMNVTIRMYADRHHISLSAVSTRVSLAPADNGETRFHYQIELEGALSPLERRRLLLTARQSPVGQMLSGRISLHDGIGTSIAAVAAPMNNRGNDAGARDCSLEFGPTSLRAGIEPHEPPRVDHMLWEREVGQA